MDYKLYDPDGYKEMCDCLAEMFQERKDAAMVENLKKFAAQFEQEEPDWGDALKEASKMESY